MADTDTENEDSLFGIPMPYLYGGLGASIILAGTWFLFLQPSVGADATLDSVSNQCSDLCSLIENNEGDVKDAYKLQYCTQAYDLGGEVEKMTENGTSFCSNGVHCFSAHTCSADGTTLTASECKDFVYDYYQEYNNEDPSIAAQHVVDTYSPDNNETGVGTCDLSADWYGDNFASTEVVQE